MTDTIIKVLLIIILFILTFFAVKKENKLNERHESIKKFKEWVEEQRRNKK